MIDTVQIRHRIPMLPLPELAVLGFHHERSKNGKTVWVRNDKSRPRLTWSQTAGGDWLSAEVSLPILLFGRNTVQLRETDILPALDQLSVYVQEAVGVAFNAATALVGRVDYCYDFQVGEANLLRYLAAVKQASLPRLNIHTVGNSVSFGNKSRMVVLYDKEAEVTSRRQGRQMPESVEEARGVLRLEVRYLRSKACKGLQEKYHLSAQTSHSLLSSDVARQEIASTLSALGLNKELPAYDRRIDRLREHYGDTRLVRSLVGFLSLFDTYGEDLWRRQIAGYSRSLFYDHRQQAKAANALLASKVSLPPLSISPELQAAPNSQ